MLVLMGSTGLFLALCDPCLGICISLIDCHDQCQRAQQAIGGWPRHNCFELALFGAHDCPVTGIEMDGRENIVCDLDREQIRAVISAQVASMRTSDFVKAVGLTTAALQRQAGSPEAFIESLKSTYRPVINSRSFVFEDLKQVMGIVSQSVLFFFEEGDVVLASYTMEKQEDGSWKISGCYLAPVK